MKKQITLLLAVILALLLNVPLLYADEVTVADGNSTSSYVPFSIDWFSSEQQHVQFIYPASMLANAGLTEGAMIDQLRFHGHFYQDYYFPPSGDMFMLEVRFATCNDSILSGSKFDNLSSLESVGSTSYLEVYGDEELNIYTGGFVYDGGSLLVDITCSGVPDMYSSVEWYGTWFPSAGSQQYFIPKTTFSFWKDDYYQPSCPKPTKRIVSNVTSSSADISWSDSTAFAWNMRYSTDNYSWTYVHGSYAYGVTTKTYTLNGLNPNTTYYLQLQADCGADESEWLTTLSFNTPCASILPDPFSAISFETSEGFVAGAGNMDECWKVGNLGSSSNSSYIPYVLSNSSYSHTGNNCLYLSANRGSSYWDDYYKAYAVLPKIAVASSIANYQTQFYMRKATTSTSTSYSYNDTLWVGIVSDPANMSSLRIVGYAVNTTTDYKKYTVTFSDYTGGSDGYVVFLAAVDTRSSATYKYANFYVDDIVIEAQPNCIEPTDLTVSGISDHQVVLNWTTGGSETSWNVQFKTVEGYDWIEVDADTVPFTLTGLDDYTSYNVRVQSDCGNEQSKWCDPVSFKTLCEPFLLSEQNSYIEDFELLSSGGLPDCWYNNHYAGTSSDVWRVASSSYYSHSGSNYLCLPKISADNRNLAVLPMMNVPSANDYMIDFWYNRTSSTYTSNTEAIRVLVNTTPDTVGAVELLVVDHRIDYSPVVSAAGWYQYEAVIPMSGNLYIMIDGISGNIAASYIDDITIQKIPSCHHVGSLSASSVGRRTFTVTWTPNNHSSNVVGYQLVMDTVILNDSALSVATPIILADSIRSYSFNNLNRSTKYYVYLRPDCGSDDAFGSWRGIEVKTNAAPYIPCPQLTGLTVDSITVNSACFTWRPSTADYVGDYNFHISDTPLTDSELNALDNYSYTGIQNSYSLTDLDEYTLYYAYVRVNCTDGEVDDGTSAWTSVQFRTLSACPTPVSVSIDNIEKYSVRVNWTMSAVVDTSYTYEVEVRTADSTLVFSQSGLNGNIRNLKVTELNRNTQYYISVRTSCGGELFSPWVTSSAITLDLPHTDCYSHICGTGTSSSNLVYTSWGNTYSQQIYTAAELTAMGLSAGEISAVEFYYSGSYSSYAKEQSIYIGTTTKSVFSGYSANDFVGDLTLVYGPQRLSYPGNWWYRYEFETPFVWDGISNIIVGVITNQPTGYSHSSSSGWSTYGTYTGDYKSIYRYRDGSAYTVSDLSTGNGGRSTYRPNINFVTCYTDPCPALKRAPVFSGIDHNSAHISWTAAEGDFANTYELYLDTIPMGDSLDNSRLFTGIDSTNYHAIGLASNKTYYAYVRVSCIKGVYNDGVSGWSPVDSFTTELSCLRPSGLTVSNVLSHSVDLQWLDPNDASAWNIELIKYKYVNRSDSTVIVIPVTDASVSVNDSTGLDTVRYTLENLDSYTDYAVRIQADCSDTTSHWGYEKRYFHTLGDNTDVNYVYFTPFTPSDSLTIMLRERNGDNFYFVVRDDGLLKDSIYLTINPTDGWAKVWFNGKIHDTRSPIALSDTAALVFKVVAQDTNFRHNYKVYVRLEDCATPYNLDTVNVGRRNATITWSMGGTGLQTYDYILAYSAVDEADRDSLAQQFTDSLHSLNLTVERGSTCYFYLRHNCGDTHSPWVSISFNSKSTGAWYNPIVNDGTATDSYIPLYSCENNNINFVKSQFIYPSEMLTGLRGRSICRMTFFSTEYEQYFSSSYEIRIGITSADNLSEAFEPDPSMVVFEDAYVEVYKNEWVVYFQNGNFDYPESGGNLLVQIVNNYPMVNPDPGYCEYPSFYGTYTHIYGISRYEELEMTPGAYPFSPGGEEMHNENTSDFLPKVKFTYYYVSDPCTKVENISVTDLQSTEVTLDWTSPADYPNTYDVLLSQTRLTDFTRVTPTVNVGTSTCTLDGLTPNTHYYVYIKTNCGYRDGASGWSEFEFTTQTDCYYPLTVAATVTGKQSAHVAWTPGTNAQANNFAYILSTTAIPESMLDNTPATAQNIQADYVDLTGLNSSTHYYFYVHNNCGTLGGSPWIGTEFSTPAFQPAVINLQVNDITYNSFVASWERDSINFGSETEWQIACTRWGRVPSDWITVTETTRYVFGLNAYTGYTFYVRPIENGIPGNQVSIDVATLRAPGPGGCFITGTGTYTSYNLPCANWDNYGYSQQIYNAYELSVGEIVSIAFQYGSSSPMTNTNVKIYLGHTSKSEFASGSDWVSFEDLTEVYSGPFNCSGNGVFNTFDLTTPFYYNGSDNLVVAVHKEGGEYPGPNCEFMTTALSAFDYKTLYYRDYYTDFSETSPAYGSCDWHRNNIQLCYAPVSCAPQKVTVDNITTTSADVSWKPGGSEAEWEYVCSYAEMTDDELDVASATTVTYPAVSLTNLTIGADVYMYIRSKCSGNTYGEWVLCNFHTIETCSAPINLNAYSVAQNQMTMMVESGAIGIPLSYTYEYWMTGSDDVMTVTGSDSVVVTDLEAGTYEWRAKATCQTETYDGVSHWTVGNNVVVCGDYFISDNRNYEHDFENISSIADACMTAEVYYRTPDIYSSPDCVHSGSYSLRFSSSGSGYYSYSSNRMQISLPRFESSENIYLSFYHMNYSSTTSNGQFIYGYQSADGIFHPLDTLNRRTYFTQARYSLGELPDSSSNVAILFANGYDYGYLDDIRVAVQRNTVFNDTLAGFEDYYNKYGFSVSRPELMDKVDTTLTRLTQNGVVDSLYTLNLHIRSLWRDTLRDNACPAVPYQFFNKTIVNPATGWYYDTISVSETTDTIHALYLTVNPDAYLVASETQAICPGTSYIWRNYTLSESGEYYDTVLNIQGCDSIYCLTLTVNPTYLIDDTVTVFSHDLPYTWHGRDLTDTGVYYDSLQTVDGCDSVYQLTLTVNPYICVAPTNLVAERTGLKSFRFSWENPTIGTEDEQANNFTYLFSETAVDPDTVAPTKTCSTVTAVTATGSLYNNEYHFYVKNVSNGVSSEWVETTISSLSQYPEVGNLTVENVETKAVTLSWTRHQYGTERKWKVDVTLKSDGSAVKSVVANNDTFRITGLEALTEYTFTVSPRINSATFGDPMSIDATTLAMPAAPINLVAELIDTRYVRFSWENGAEITPDSYSYKVSAKFIDMSKDKYNDNPDSTIECTTVDLGPLTYATKYYLYVRCNVGDAASDWSMVDIKTGQKNPPVTNLHAEDETPTSLTAVWTKNQFGTEPRWIVVLRRASDDLLIDSVNKNVQNHTFTGLERGTEYILSVYPRYNGGATGLGTVATTVVKTSQTCEAPTNLTVDSDTYRYLTFNWENPTLGTSNEEPNNFTIIFRSSSEPIDPDGVTPKATGLTEATYSSEKLTKGATYYFYVRNEYDGAVSAWTGPIVFTVPATAPTTIDGSDDDEFIAGKVIPAEAFVNMGVLHVENLVEGTDVTLIDAACRTIHNGKADNTHMEFDLTVRGVYMVVLRGGQNQILKVVY